MNKLGKNVEETLINISDANISDFAYITTVSMLNYQIIADINDTDIPQPHAYQRVLDQVNIVFYLIICALGLVGNGLVIYVVLMYAKMKTVTNMYILNLAISDVLFLTMLPITATTVIVKHWIFGLVMCKVHFVLCAVNIFGGAFNLCVMSADRYLAVCYPIQSLRYRTPRVAVCLCLSVWVLTFLVMLPVILYTSTVNHHTYRDRYSCKIEWPTDQIISSGTAFVWYSFFLGFVVPVFFISVFYVRVIIRLRRVGAAKKSLQSQRSHGRVTRLIFTVVTVYVVCWLPYWCFQVQGSIINMTRQDISRILLINGFTVLSYANSMLNPLLYAFLSDNFRQSFVKAFTCLSTTVKARSLRQRKNVLPCNSQTGARTGATRATVDEKLELSAMEHCLEASHVPSENQKYSIIHQDESGFLYIPVPL